MPSLAWFGLGVPEAGGGNPLAVAPGAVDELDPGGDVGDALGLSIAWSNGAPALGDAVAVACSATLGACRDDQNPNAVTEAATTAVVTPPRITRSRREGILTPSTNAFCRPTVTPPPSPCRSAMEDFWA